MLEMKRLQDGKQKSALPIAMSRASRFVEIAIKTTFSYGGDTRFGVMLESAMPFLKI